MGVVSAAGLHQRDKMSSATVSSYCSTQQPRNMLQVLQRLTPLKNWIKSCPPASSSGWTRSPTEAATGLTRMHCTDLQPTSHWTPRPTLTPIATNSNKDLNSSGKRPSMLPKPRQSVAWHSQKLGEAYIAQNVACSSKRCHFFFVLWELPTKGAT